MALKVDPHQHPSAAPIAGGGGVGGNTYEPRRSERVGDRADEFAQADGDTWVEKIAVCEGTAPGGGGQPRLVLRSYFRNQRTRQRVWDEPPSGASKIRFATASDRHDAEQRMRELQTTLDGIPPDDSDYVPVPEDSTAAPRGKKSGGGTKQAAGSGGGGGFLSRFRKKDKAPAFRQVDESQDLNLQRAIARSMADQGGVGSRGASSGGDSPPLWFDPDKSDPTATGGLNGIDDEDDEDMALAKALSMSESAHTPPSNASTNTNASMSDEEMLQRALEESRRDAERSAAAAGVAILPSSHSSPWEEFELLPAGSGECETSLPASFPNDLPPELVDDEDDDHWNRKMPAKQSPHKPPPPAPALDEFDPSAFSLTPTAHDSTPKNTPAKVSSRGRLFGRVTGGARQKSNSLEDDAGVV